MARLALTSLASVDQADILTELNRYMDTDDMVTVLRLIDGRRDISTKLLTALV